jgi:hypothetical protein
MAALTDRPSTDAVVVRRSLDQLATEARDAHAAVEAHLLSAVACAIRAGEALTEAKGRLPHGEWLPWLRSNFPGSARTAQSYMKLAQNAQRVAHLPSIRDAVAALAERTPPLAPRPTARGKGDRTAEQWPFEPVAHIVGQLCLPGLHHEPPLPPPAANDDDVPAELGAMWRELRAEFDDVTIARLHRLAVDKLREEGARQGVRGT